MSTNENKDDSLYPIAVLIDELRNEDVQVYIFLQFLFLIIAIYISHTGQCKFHLVFFLGNIFYIYISLKKCFSLIWYARLFSKRICKLLIDFLANLYILIYYVKHFITFFQLCSCFFFLKNCTKSE